MTIDIELWKNNVINAVMDIASKEFQKSTWFGEGDVISSPDDVYIALFDDFVFKEAFLNDTDVNLSDEQKEAGKKLIDAMETYSPGDSTLPEPDVMIDDPEWEKVRKVAREFLESMGVTHIEPRYWETKSS